MKDAIKEEWEWLSEKYFCNCIESMHNRCKFVIKTKDNSTKYWYYEPLD